MWQCPDCRASFVTQRIAVRHAAKWKHEVPTFVDGTYESAEASASDGIANIPRPVPEPTGVCEITVSDELGGGDIEHLELPERAGSEAATFWTCGLGETQQEEIHVDMCDASIADADVDTITTGKPFDDILSREEMLAFVSDDNFKRRLDDAEEAFKQAQSEKVRFAKFFHATRKLSWTDKTVLCELADGKSGSIPTVAAMKRWDSLLRKVCIDLPLMKSQTLTFQIVPPSLLLCRFAECDLQQHLLKTEKDGDRVYSSYCTAQEFECLRSR